MTANIHVHCGSTLFCLLVTLAALALPVQAEPRFIDVTKTAGIDFLHRHGGSGRYYLPETMGSGGSVLDVDNDGWMDLYLVQSAALPGYSEQIGGNRLFRNLGNGRFADITKSSGAGDSGYGQGSVAADYDGDGDTDIYVTNLGQNVLLSNDGKGRFTDVTAKAGVGGAAWSSSATFFDADADGDLDLYVVNYLVFSPETHRECRDKTRNLELYCHPDVYPAAQDRFYLNQGNGTYREATKSAGLVQKGGKGLGVIAADIDLDGDQDLYIANDSTPNFLFLNQGDGQFQESGLWWGGAFNADGQTEAGMGVDAADVNADGWLDLIVTNLSMEANALYLGSAQGLEHATRQSGLLHPSWPVLGFGVELADFDNDGDNDLYVANGDVQNNINKINDALQWAQPDQLLINDGKGKFRELSAQALGDPATPRVSRAALRIDYDNDGRLDLLVTHNNDRARLYRNQGEVGNWIGFRPAATAHTAQDFQILGEAGTRLPGGFAMAGSGYQSSGDPRIHIGLGESRTLSLQTPLSTGGIQKIAHCAAGRYHPVRAMPDGPALCLGSKQ